MLRVFLSCSLILLTSVSCNIVETWESNPTTTPAQTPSVGSAILSWDPVTTLEDGSPLQDLLGYTIYYGTAPGLYTHTIPVSDPAAVTYSVGDLPGGGITYYFAVTALSASAGESAHSVEVSKTIP